MEKIFDIISKNYDSYTKGQQIIAGYIMENYDESAFMTLEQLASSAGVSTTSVIRFSRELGYDGYTSMQRALRLDLRNKAAIPADSINSSPIPDDSLLHQVIFNDINNIEQTFNHLDPKAVERASDIIGNAGELYILGLRRSYSLSVYAFSRLSQVRQNVRLIGTPGLNYPEEIASIEKGDACLSFLFPRYSHTTISLLDFMRNLGMKTIVVTSMNHIAIDRYADVVLPCETRCFLEKTSYVAPISLINYLTALYMQNHQDSAQAMLSKAESIYATGSFLGL